MTHVWIIEMLAEGSWEPMIDDGVYYTRKNADAVKREIYSDWPTGWRRMYKIRVAKYERAVQGKYCGANK